MVKEQQQQQKKMHVEIYPVNKILSVPYSIASYMCIIGEQISRKFIILHDWNSKPVAQLSISPSPTPGNHHSIDHILYTTMMTY